MIRKKTQRTAFGDREKRTADKMARISKGLLSRSLQDPTCLLESLGTRPDGLTTEEAKDRLERFGFNLIARERVAAWSTHLLGAFRNPFVGILVILAIASFVTEWWLAPPAEQDLTTLVIITILVLISVVLTFIQEYQANRAAQQLLSMVQSRTHVFRDGGNLKPILSSEIVPGDILQLAAGDMIPADVRLLDVNNLSVNESALTGESLPVEKSITSDVGEDAEDLKEYLEMASALDLDNIGFMGTSVVSGTARAVVVSSADDTYFGSMSEELVGHHPPTSFDQGVASVSLLLIRFMVIMVPIIFLINGVTQGDWFSALLFGLAVAVGLTPEMLPAIITGNLAKGTLEMARAKTIVKRLNAVQNLGAMDVLCTDKTGTLTDDSVALQTYVDVSGAENAKVLLYTYLNSSFQTGLRNPLDEAVLAHPEVEDLALQADTYQKMGEIPFETTRRRMSVVLKKGAKRILVTKGAVDEMLAICTHVTTPDGDQPLEDASRQRAAQQANTLNAEGLRVLLVGYRDVKARPEGYSISDEEDLTLLGLVGFLDPPKATAGPAIQALKTQGVSVRVLTGDSVVATRRTCADIGFEIQGMMEGHEVERLPDEALTRAVETHNVFVRTTPLQKARIVKALKSKGHTVGFLGDGINDALALRDADVGISVDNAVDIAKESAEIILLEKDLMVLEEAITLGRRVFGNIMKYIKMTVSSNFGNVFSVLVASIFLPFPPMLPLHLLVQNLLYDISQTSIPWDTVDEEFLAKPRRWNPEGITRFTLYVGPVSSIFDFSTFILMWFIFGANHVGEQALFHSGWFVLGLLSQTLIVHLIRTRKVPFFQSTAAPPVIVTTGAVMLIGLMIPYTGFGQNLGLVALPGSYFPWLLLTLLAYCAVIQWVKSWYIRRFDAWL